ncbi:ABC transporter substrate-binding protein [uncultured Caballeronia sp.]|uniref:ABC transporter substrate-binding protein n=1 Tax=uncultured Caballeronia sp. TaxID=1827198 RepID=UPI0035CA1E8E
MTHAHFALKRIVLGLLCIGLTVARIAYAASPVAVDGGDIVIERLPGVIATPLLENALPAAIKTSKVLKIATDLTPPISFHADDGALIGIDADIAKALGIILNVNVQMTDVGAGAAIVPSILSGRYDMTLSGINDDPALEQQVDVVDYMYDATTIMTLGGNPHGIKSMSDLCGKVVAVPVGTFQERLVEAESKRCSTDTIHIMAIPKMPDVLQAVRAGRADATVNGYATSVYTTRHQVGNGTGLAALPNVRLAEGYLGILVAKNNKALRDSVVAALQQMVDSGAYSAILKKWDLDPLAVHTVKVNDAQQLTAN